MSNLIPVTDLEEVVKFVRRSKKLRAYEEELLSRKEELLGLWADGILNHMGWYDIAAHIHEQMIQKDRQHLPPRPGQDQWLKFRPSLERFLSKPSADEETDKGPYWDWSWMSWSVDEKNRMWIDVPAESTCGKIARYLRKNFGLGVKCYVGRRQVCVAAPEDVLFILEDMKP
jgi:hypothetical protein